MNIDRIRANVVGDYGLSSSNKYHISFLLPNNTNSQPETLAAYLGRKGLSTNSFTADPAEYDRNSYGENDTAMILSYLADEVNIPGFSIATGDFKGFRPGINARYPHTRNPNECSIAFLQNMKHTPLKFFRYWTDYMFGFNLTELDGSQEPYGLMNYYDDYVCDIVIDKLEPNTNTTTKLNATSSYETHNVVTRTILRKAYPYLSNDFTLSNGPNQPVRVGVTFFYEYMQTEEKEQKNIERERRSFRRSEIGVSADEDPNRVVEPESNLPPSVTRIGSSFRNLIRIRL